MNEAAETTIIPPPQKDKDLKTMVQVVYGCYLASLLLGFTGLIGIILAYIKKGDAEGTIYASHFQWQIRTFWISFIGSIIGVVLSIIVIGWFLLLAVCVWWIYRSVKGWMKVYEGKAIEDPTAWF